MGKFSRWGLLGSLLLSAALVGACADEHNKSDSDASSTQEPASTDDAGDASKGDAGSSSGKSDAGSNGDSDAASSEDGDGATPSANDDAGDATDAGPAPDPTTCPAGCDDGNDCTTDTCDNGTCEHALTPSACDPGYSCDIVKGCVQGAACSSDSECADDDPCTINERCDPSQARCVFSPLDRDGDGEAPVSCGGTDCDDANPRVGANREDRCDGVDNDCDGTVDNGTSMCGTGEMCDAGQCVCNDGLNMCGIAGCVDLKTNHDNCGTCGINCGTGGECVDGACTCPAPAEQCQTECADLTVSMLNCGGCGTYCAPFTRGGVAQACVDSQCVVCGTEGAACCTLYGQDAACGGALTCSGTIGSPDATCECPSSATKCGDSCVDTSTDGANCGSCGTVCARNEQCQAGECVACGVAGSACCQIGALQVCGRGLTCQDGTCN